MNIEVIHWAMVASREGMLRDRMLAAPPEYSALFGADHRQTFLQLQSKCNPAEKGPAE